MVKRRTCTLALASMVLCAWEATAFVLAPVPPHVHHTRRCAAEQSADEPERGGGSSSGEEPVRVERLSKDGRDFVVEHFRDGSQSFREVTPPSVTVAEGSTPDDESDGLREATADAVDASSTEDLTRKAQWQALKQQAKKGRARFAAQAEPEPRYRPPGSEGAFDLGPNAARRSARAREDAQVERLLRVFSNANSFLVGSASLALLAACFGWALQSGMLERPPPDPEAVEYMLRTEIPRPQDLEGILKIEYEE